MQLVSTLLYLAVTCSMLVLPEENVCRFFWEIASRYFCMHLVWFNSVYMFMSVFKGVCGISGISA